jgi:hypothetical protein
MNLPDIGRMVINLKLIELSSTRNGILALLPKGTIQDTMIQYIPQKINIKGIYKGSMDNMYTDLQLASSFGNATIKGTFKNAAEKDKAVYDLSAGLKGFDLATILSDTTMGKINGQVKLTGKGFDPKPWSPTIRYISTMHIIQAILTKG